LTAKPLEPAFYLRPTVTVARDLIGLMLVREIRGETLAGRIVETEAYREDEPASHSFRGPTKRNSPMYLDGGVAYVFFIYGMYDCFNVVTEPAGSGCAVLIRALEPVDGIETMWHNRFPGRPFEPDKVHLVANGPGKLCRALRITREASGTSLLSGPIRIQRGPGDGSHVVGTSRRIGIKKGVDLPWRFFEKDNPSVSKKI
jgi:DNA-3-methyladenine glycosylase